MALRSNKRKTFHKNLEETVNFFYVISFKQPIKSKKIDKDLKVFEILITFTQNLYANFFQKVAKGDKKMF